MKESTPEAYNQQVAAIHQELGITADYASIYGLKLQLECQYLVETELDVFSRQPLMEASAHTAWQTMKVKAREDDIELGIVSVFRSAEYQKKIFLNKLAKGQSLAEIIKVNAAPGYSEHHTGQAIDITCPEFEHLSEEFENSPAFAWLCKNADLHGFALSFPRNNPFGFLYEPWHWKFSLNIFKKG